jgi:hypothetical protein
MIRLAAPRSPGAAARAPAPLRRALPERGAALTFVGSGGGVPLKIDQGGSIIDRGEPWLDYFVADTRFRAWCVRRRGLRRARRPARRPRPRRHRSDLDAAGCADHPPRLITRRRRRSSPSPRGSRPTLRPRPGRDSRSVVPVAATLPGGRRCAIAPGPPGGSGCSGSCSWPGPCRGAAVPSACLVEPRAQLCIVVVRPRATEWAASWRWPRQACTPSASPPWPLTTRQG